MINFSDLIKESTVLKVDRWPTYDGGDLDRDSYVTASEATRCARQLAYSKRAKAKHPLEATEEELEAMIKAVGPNHKFGYFERGHAIEAWAVKMIRTALLAGEKLLIAGNEQVSMYLNTFRISGTPDGIFYTEDTPMELTLLEIKSTGTMPASVSRAHQAQTNINMGLINHLLEEYKEKFAKQINCPYTEGMQITSAKVLYIESNNYMNMVEFKVEYDDGVAMIAAYEKGRQVFIGDDVHLPENVKPEGRETAGECWFCEFKRHCNMIDGDVKQEASGNMPRFQDLPVDLKEVITEFTELKLISDDKKKRMDDLRDIIVDMFQQNPDQPTKMIYDMGNAAFSLELKGTKRTSLITNKVKRHLVEAGEDLGEFMQTTESTALYFKKAKIE